MLLVFMLAQKQYGICDHQLILDHVVGARALLECEPAPVISKLVMWADDVLNETLYCAFGLRIPVSSLFTSVLPSI